MSLIASYLPSLLSTDLPALRHPGIVTPPLPVVAIDMLGISMVTVLLDKIVDTATDRLGGLAQRRPGPVVGTLMMAERMVPSLEPCTRPAKRSQGQRPTDQTRLASLRHARREGRRPVVSWGFHSREVVIFILAAGWSHDVPEEHLGPVEGPGIMVVDRYKAYQAVDKVKAG